MSVTDTIAAARRQASPTRNRIVVRRTVKCGAEPRRKNQSGELLALIYGEVSLSLSIEGGLLQRGFKKSDAR